MSGAKIIFLLGVGSSVAMAIFALMMFLKNYYNKGSQKLRAQMTLFEGQLWSDVDYSNMINLQNLLKNNAYKLSIF